MYDILPYSFNKAKELGVVITPSKNKNHKIDIFYKGEFMSKMIIRNSKGHNIKGCIQFSYNGYGISASNILEEKIYIFKDLTFEPVIEVKNIPDAIKMIDNLNNP